MIDELKAVVVDEKVSLRRLCSSVLEKINSLYDLRNYFSQKANHGKLQSIDSGENENDEE